MLIGDGWTMTHVTVLTPVALPNKPVQPLRFQGASDDPLDDLDDLLEEDTFLGGFPHIKPEKTKETNEPKSVVERVRQSVLDKTFFDTHGKDYSGRDILRLSYELINESGKKWIGYNYLESYVVFADTGKQEQKQVKKGLDAGLNQLNQVGLLVYGSHERRGWYVEKTDIGRQVLGEPLEETEAQKQAQKTPSLLDKLQAKKNADLRQFAQALELTKMKVLTTNYADQVTGWDVLKLTGELQPPWYSPKYWMGKGVAENRILTQFVLDEDKGQVKKALAELQKLRLIARVEDATNTEPRWIMTQEGKTAVANGDPVATGQLTNEVLDKLLQDQIMKLRTQRTEETDKLRQFEATAQKAQAVLAQLHQEYLETSEAAINLLEAAEKAEKKDRLTLETQAQEKASAVALLKHRIELEAQTEKLFAQNLTTAKQRYEAWCEWMDDSITHLVTAQARMRFTQINQSIETLMAELDAIKQKKQVPAWTSLMNQVNLDFYRSEAGKQAQPVQKQPSSSVQKRLDDVERQLLLDSLKQGQQEVKAQAKTQAAS